MTAALEGGEWAAARPGRTLPQRKDPIPILQEGGWAPGWIWTGEKSHPHWDSIPDRPARSQSLYRLIYRAHTYTKYVGIFMIDLSMFIYHTGNYGKFSQALT